MFLNKYVMMPSVFIVMMPSVFIILNIGNMHADWRGGGGATTFHKFGSPFRWKTYSIHKWNCWKMVLWPLANKIIPWISFLWDFFWIRAYVQQFWQFSWQISWNKAFMIASFSPILCLTQNISIIFTLYV